MSTTKRAIVIGTGAGGLGAAVRLGQWGYDVVALEQGENLGGYMAPFYRQGYQFCPGVHYMGQCGPGQGTERTFASLGIDTKGLFCELDPEGFDRYRFGDWEMRQCRGLDRYRDRLISEFPRQEQALVRFFKHVDHVRDAFVAQSAWRLHGFGLEHLQGVWGIGDLLRWSSSTYEELLADYFVEPRLRAVLAAANPDYGLPPSRASAIVGVALLAHYGEGAWFPRGGSAALRDALVAKAQGHGVRFRTKSKVVRIRTEGGRAVGAELDDGEFVNADLVISDADPVITYGQLLADEERIPLRLRRKVRQCEPSSSMFSVQLGMRRDLSQRGLGAFNQWSYADWNLDGAYPVGDTLPKSPVFFLAANSLKDGSKGMAPPGCTSLEIITMVPFKRFERWKDLPMGRRGAEYEGEKKRLVDWVLAHVEARFPKLLGDVEVQEAWSPLTCASYANAVEGGAYGPANVPEQTGRHRFSPLTPLSNVFLAGAGASSCGVGACLQSGLLAADLARDSTARVPRGRRPVLERWREALGWST